MTVEPTTQDKQITIAVPEDRVAEFYAFYGRFLAGFPGRRGRGRGHHRCGGPHRHADETRRRPAAARRRRPRWPTSRSPSPSRRSAYRSSTSGSRASWRRSPAPRPPGAGAAAAGRGGPHHAFREPAPWSAADGEQAAWLYGKLAPPARALFDELIDAPGERRAGNEIAARLGLDKGAHGVAGILAWPGRYSRKLSRELPIATEGRPDGGTDYYMEPAIAELFAAARERVRSDAG